MKKSLFSLVLVIMLFLTISDVSASSIDYELKITNDRHFYETITYNIENDTQNEYLRSVLNNSVYFDINNTMPYIKTVNNNQNEHVVVLKKDYPSASVKNSKLLNECFKSFFYDEDSYGITYYASEPFKCYDRADKITISVVTDLNVILNTADEVIGNKYIWNIIGKDFLMDLSLGEYNPNSDVLPPIADDEVTPSDDIDQWPDGDLDRFPYLYVVGIGACVILAISFVLVKKRLKNTNN